VADGDNSERPGRWWECLIAAFLALAVAGAAYWHLTDVEQNGGGHSLDGWAAVLYHILGKWAIVGFLGALAAFNIFLGLWRLLAPPTLTHRDPVTATGVALGQLARAWWEDLWPFPAQPPADKPKEPTDWWDALIAVGFILTMACMCLLGVSEGWWWWVGLAAGVPMLTGGAVGKYVAYRKKRAAAPRVVLCPGCARRLPAPDRPGDVWTECPSCAPSVARLAAPARGLSRLRTALLVVCVLLAPLGLLCAVGTAKGLWVTVGTGPRVDPDELWSCLVFGPLGTLAYLFLVGAATLFGKAAVPGPRRRLQLVAATAGAGLCVCLITTMVVVICLIS
jgi:hypothetical protein